MAIVNGSLELGYKNAAWFAANPTLVLKEGQIVYLEQTGTYKIGNGVSTLSALSFLGVSSETQTLQNVTDLGSTTTNSITANSFITTGGLSTQFVKGNGSLDSSDYITLADVPNFVSVLKHEVKASVALTKGQAVYVSGASGTNMLVSKASNVSEPTSSKTLGLIAQDLAINGQGFVITEGLLANINTNSATIGDPVWLGVDGALIYGLVNKPYAPAHLVFIGIVTRVSATVGEIFVKVQNGFELKEIHDVDLKTNLPNNNEILTFESSTSLWKPKTVVSALGFTPYNSTNPSAYISGITSGMVTTALGFTPYNSTNPNGYITGITSGNVTTALGFTPYNATNPSGYITSSALSTYVPYTGATANLNLGTNTLTTPTINGVSGLLSFGSTDRVNVGNYATPSSQRIFTVGQDTAWLTMGSIPTSTSDFGIWLNQSTPTVNNAVLVANSNVAVFQAIQSIYLKINGTIVNTTSLYDQSFTPYAIGSGARTNFTFTKPNNTGQTASTSIAGFNYNGGTRQWATGAITTQNENVWGATTYSFVGASTITNAYGNVFNAPIAGTNATITNNWAAQFNAKINVTEGVNTFRGAREVFIGLNTDTGSGDFPGIWFNTSGSRTVSNYAFLADTTNTIFNAPTTGTLLFRIGNVQKFRVYESGNVVIQNAGTYTDAGFRLDVNGTGRFQNTLTLATGTTTIAPLKLTAGTNLTTPVNGSFEFDGTNLYFTVGGVRKMVTLI